MKSGFGFLAGLYLASNLFLQIDNLNKTRIILNPMEYEGKSFAKIYLVEKGKKDTLEVFTDHFGEAILKLDTTKLYHGFVFPGKNYLGEPGDQFVPYRTEPFIPSKGLNIINKLD